MSALEIYWQEMASAQVRTKQLLRAERLYAKRALTRIKPGDSIGLMDTRRISCHSVSSRTWQPPLCFQTRA